MAMLCHVSDLPENEGRGFTVELNGEPRNVILVRRSTHVYAYINQCPHRGTSLDWMPDRFMDPEQHFLQCATHEARFEVETGRCVSGPCRGKALVPVHVVVEHGQVFVNN